MHVYPVPEGILCISSDISERKQAELEREKLQEQLVRSEKLSAVGQLTSGVAHEFNNILAIIRGNVQMTISEMKGDPELVEMLKIVDKQTRRGAEIVTSMMAFAHPGKPSMEVCDIRGVIDEVLKLEKRFFELENIKIEKDYSYTSMVNIDKSQMQQIFLNIVNNARHAIMHKRKGTIRFSIKDMDDDLEIRVQDSGIGMDEETRKNIFNPFFTTKGARAKDRLGIKGTGLGLSVSYMIVHNHKGAISVESEEGKGAIFIITLPKAELLMPKKVKEKKKEPGVKALEGTKELNILVVDDEKDITDFLTKVFNRTIHKDVTIANSGKEALSLFKENSYDLVFLDMILPDMNGEEIFKEMKKSKPDIIIVFVSGQLGLVKAKLKEMGAFTFLQKPFDVNDIFKVLNKVSKEKGSALE